MIGSEQMVHEVSGESLAVGVETGDDDDLGRIDKGLSLLFLLRSKLENVEKSVSKQVLGSMVVSMQKLLLLRSMQRELEMFTSLPGVWEWSRSG